MKFNDMESIVVQEGWHDIEAFDDTVTCCDDLTLDTGNCAICEADTPWISISFGAFFCSEECLSEFLAPFKEQQIL